MYSLTYILLLSVSVYETTCYNTHPRFLSPEEATLQSLLQEVHRDPTNLTFQFNLNNFFDYVINTIKFVMSDSGDLTLSLPDIARPFKRGLIRGEVTGSGGYLRNIASLQRTDDTQLTMDGAIIYLSASLGLQVFDAGFRNYSVELGKISQQGDVTFKVAKNSLKMVISFDLLHICSLKVESIKFDKLEGVQIQVNGLGDFQALIRILTNWTMQSFKRTIRTAVNSQMEININAALKRLMGSFCKDS